jgi:hypothetical protein
MTNENGLCPICRRPVRRTRRHNIGGHFDKAGNPCPASYELPYRFTTPETWRHSHRRRPA